MANQKKWQIPGTILNILWGDVYPRLLAMFWREDRKWFPNAAYSFSTRNLLEIACNPGPLHDEANRFLDGIDPPSNGETKKRRNATTPAEYDQAYDEYVKTNLGKEIDRLIELQVGGAESQFGRRASKVKEYLTDPRSIPIRIIENIEAYDFLLSRDGIELFKLPRPKDAVDLLHRYTIRKSGRMPIGIPDLLAGANGANGHVDLVQLDNPTNPSLIVSRPEKRKVGETEALFQARQQVRLVREGEGYWQIPGAVYRWLAYEHPRIIATIWLHEFRETTDRGKPWAYIDRYSRWGDDGLRRIFEERLEISLPDSGDMPRFNPPSAHGGGAEDYVDGDISINLWNPTDINVVDKGFFFPELVAISEDVGEDPLDIMLKDIAAGRAGNPVITGSFRPGGGG